MNLMTKAAMSVACALITCLTPAFSQPNPMTIDNYPRHGSELPPEYRALMQPIVDDVLRLVKSGGKASVRVVGHADLEYGKTAKENREDETRYSLERATVAQQTLLSMIGAQASLAGISNDRLLQNVKVTVEGLGTKQLVKPNPQSEEDRKKNRRVEIFWTAFAPTPDPHRESRLLREAVPMSLKQVGFGIWNGPAKVTVVGADVVRFKIKNTNVLPTTITIEHDPFRVKETRQIRAMGTADIEFSMQTGKTVEWHFDVSTQSDAFIVTWSAMSYVPDK